MIRNCIGVAVRASKVEEPEFRSYLVGVVADETFEHQVDFMAPAEQAGSNRERLAFCTPSRQGRYQDSDTARGSSSRAIHASTFASRGLTIPPRAGPPPRLRLGISNALQRPAAFRNRKRIDVSSTMKRRPIGKESLVPVHGPVDAEAGGSWAEGVASGRRSAVAPAHRSTRTSSPCR